MKRRSPGGPLDEVPEPLRTFRFADWAEQVADLSPPDHWPEDDPQTVWTFRAIRAHHLWRQARREHEAAYGWPTGTLSRIIAERRIDPRHGNQGAPE